MFAPQCGQNGNINYHIAHKFALNVTFTGRLFVKSKQWNWFSRCALCKVCIAVMFAMSGFDVNGVHFLFPPAFLFLSICKLSPFFLFID